MEHLMTFDSYLNLIRSVQVSYSINILLLCMCCMYVCKFQSQHGVFVIFCLSGLFYSSTYLGQLTQLVHLIRGTYYQYWLTNIAYMS